MLVLVDQAFGGDLRLERRALGEKRLQRARPGQRGIEQPDQIVGVDLVQRVPLRLEADLLEPDLRELRRQLAPAVEERRVLLLEVREAGLLLEVAEAAVGLLDLALERGQRFRVEQLRGS